MIIKKSFITRLRVCSTSLLFFYWIFWIPNEWTIASGNRDLIVFFVIRVWDDNSDEKVIPLKNYSKLFSFVLLLFLHSSENENEHPYRGRLNDFGVRRKRVVGDGARTKQIDRSIFSFVFKVTVTTNVSFLYIKFSHPLSTPLPLVFNFIFFHWCFFFSRFSSRHFFLSFRFWLLLEFEFEFGWMCLKKILFSFYLLYFYEILQSLHFSVVLISFHRFGSFVFFLVLILDDTKDISKNNDSLLQAITFFLFWSDPCIWKLFPMDRASS